MRNLTHRKTQSGHFFPKLWHFFVILEKWKGETSPPLVLCAWWCSTAVMVRDDDELFLCLVDRRKAFSLISSWDHCQRSSPLQISARCNQGLNLCRTWSSGLELDEVVAVVITTTSSLKEKGLFQILWTLWKMVRWLLNLILNLKI